MKLELITLEPMRCHEPFGFDACQYLCENEFGACFVSHVFCTTDMTKGPYFDTERFPVNSPHGVVFVDFAKAGKSIAVNHLKSIYRIVKE
jgi:hypothetical protein